MIMIGGNDGYDSLFLFFDSFKLDVMQNEEGSRCRWEQKTKSYIHRRGNRQEQLQYMNRIAHSFKS